MAIVASSHELTGSKTDVPRVRPGSVRRDALLRRLEESRAQRIVSVSAPAGYGKTTLLAQWAADEGRPVAWLSLDVHDVDPVLLLRYVLASLGTAGMSPGAASHPSAHPVQRWTGLLPAVAAALESGDPAPIVVLDDVHVLSGEALDAVLALPRLMPDGGQLVLSGREEVASVVARLRATGDVLELGPSDLALTERETGVLLGAVGVDGDAVAELHRQTEGWAAGLYLTVLGRDTTATPSTTGASLDRFVDDYFRIEHLQQLPADQRSFLARSAVLDRMCADLCDVVLDRRDSRRMLEAIERSNLFLVALDRERSWFRYHELFRQALLVELERTDPDSMSTLRGRAADWCAAAGLPEDAMTYAVAAGDTDRMAGLVTTFALPLYRTGRVATTMAWLEPFDDGHALRPHPTVAALGGLGHALQGNPFQAERYIDAGWAADPGGALPDGSADVRPWLATAEAMVCRHGPERMAQDAAAALAGLGPLSPMRATAALLHANALLLLGDTQADDALEHATTLADGSGAALAQVVARAQRAHLALERGDTRRVSALLAEARQCAEQDDFDDYMPLALLLAVEARAASCQGDAARARDRLTGVQRLRPALSYSVPFLGVQVLVVAGAAYADLGDATGARALLTDAREILRHRPRLGELVDHVSDLAARVAETTSGNETPASGLTPAELRLLPLLTTHLTFAEIGERLFVSRNTVKTQAISIYRKLDVSSRGEAVARAAGLGLVDELASAPGITLGG